MKGQGLAEYAMGIALVAVLALLAVGLFGDGLRELYSNAVTELNCALRGCTDPGANRGRGVRGRVESARAFPKGSRPPTPGGGSFKPT